MGYLDLLRKFDRDPHARTAQATENLGPEGAAVYERNEINEKTRASPTARTGATESSPDHEDPPGEVLGSSTETGEVRPTERCRMCNGYIFWKSVHGAVVCAGCHAPAARYLVAEWLWTDEGGKGRLQ